MDMDYAEILSSGGGIAGFIISFITAIIVVVCWWRIFSKAGKAGIVAIIPFFNLWTYFKIATRNHILWFILAFIPVTTWLAAIAGSFGLAKAFGKGFIFGLFLFFFPYIALPILAFGRSRYVGPDR